MEELKLFEKIHGVALAIGLRVTVDPACECGAEFTDVYFVTSISWDNRHREFNITIAENWDEGGVDGWKPDNLRPAAA